MAEISWQNVNAPSNEAVFRGMALASAGLDRAGSSFEGAGKTLTDANQANMNQADATKHAAISSIMSSVSTPEQLAAARGQINLLASSMNDQGKAAEIYKNINPQVALNSKDQNLVQAGNQTYALANENNPVELVGAKDTRSLFEQNHSTNFGAMQQQKEIEARANQFKAAMDAQYQPLDFKTQLLNEGTKYGTNLFNAETAATIAPVTNSTDRITRELGARIGSVQAFEHNRLFPTTADQARTQIQQEQKQVTQDQGVNEFDTSKDRIPEKIQGKKNTGTLGGLEVAQKINNIAETEPAKEYTRLGDQVSSYQTKLAEHKAGYAGSDNTAVYLINNLKVDDKSARAIVSRIESAKTALQKEFTDAHTADPSQPNYDLSRIPLSAIKSIASQADLDPVSSYWTGTGTGTFKEEIKKYLVSDAAREEMKAAKEQESVLSNQVFESQRQQGAHFAKHMPEAAAQTAAVIQQQKEAQDLTTALDKEIENAKRIENPPKDKKATTVSDTVSTSVFPAPKHTLDPRNLLGSKQNINKRDAAIKLRNESVDADRQKYNESQKAIKEAFKNQLNNK